MSDRFRKFLLISLLSILLVGIFLFTKNSYADTVADRFRLGAGGSLMSNANCTEPTLTEVPPFWITKTDQGNAEEAKESRDYGRYKIWDNLREPEMNEDGTSLQDFPSRAVVLRGDIVVPVSPSMDLVITQESDAEQPSVLQRGDRDYVEVVVVGSREGDVLEDFSETKSVYHKRNKAEQEVGRYLVGSTSLVARRARVGARGYMSASALVRPIEADLASSPLNDLVTQGTNHLFLVKKSTVLFGLTFPEGAVLQLATERVGEVEKFKVRNCCSIWDSTLCHQEYVFNVRSVGGEERIEAPRSIDVHSACGLFFLQNLQAIEADSLASLEALRDAITDRVLRAEPLASRDELRDRLNEAQGNIARMTILGRQKIERRAGSGRVAFEEATESLVKFPLVRSTIDRGAGVGKDVDGFLLYEMSDFHEENGCKLVHYKSAVGATDTFMLPEVACAVHQAVCVLLREDPECKDSVVQMGEAFAPRAEGSVHASHYTGFGVDFRALRKGDLVSGWGRNVRASRKKEYDRNCMRQFFRALLKSGASGIRFEDWRLLNEMASEVLIESRGKDMPSAQRRVLEREIANIQQDGPRVRNEALKELFVDFDWDRYNHIGHFHVDFNPEWVRTRVEACRPKPF